MYFLGSTREPLCVVAEVNKPLAWRTIPHPWVLTFLSLPQTQLKRLLEARALPEWICVSYFHSNRLSIGFSFTVCHSFGFLQKLLGFGVNLFRFASLSSMGICASFFLKKKVLCNFFTNFNSKNKSNIWFENYWPCWTVTKKMSCVYVYCLIPPPPTVAQKATV